MAFVDINTALVRNVAGDLENVGHLLAQSIQLATDAQGALRSYESAERAPQIKALLAQWLEESPQIMQRVQHFAQFLDGVATTYESIR